MGCTTSHDAFAAAASRAARERGRQRPRPFSSSSSSSRRAGGGADPAAVCRERAALIRAAADRRFALAAAHAAYFRSLAAVGGALRRFAAAALLPTPPPPPPSPVLTLPRSPAKPAATSTLPPSPTSSSTVSPLSHSLSDDSDSDSDRLDHARRHTRPPPAAAEPASSPAPRTHHHHHYMRNSATVPRVVYENPYAQYVQGETSYGYGYPYGPAGEVVAEERPPPPPSPPAADASPWAFFDPFIPYDQFLEDYSRGGGSLPTGSPNYSEVRRMEGIPELEDEAALAAEASKPSTSAVEEDRNVKGKSHAVPVPTNAGSKGESSDGKLQRKGSGANGDGEKPVVVPRNDSVPSNASWKSKKGGKSETTSLKGAGGGDIDGGSSTGGKKGVAFDDDDDDGLIVDTDGSGGSHNKSVQSTVATSSDPSSSPLHNGNVMEAMEEVKGRFDEALNCGAEVSRMLEVGKMPHRTTPRVLRYFSSRVVDPLSLTVPSSYCLPKRHSRLPSSKAGTSASSVNSRRNNVGDLSSTLEKLCVWEKKLYQEIKVR